MLPATVSRGQTTSPRPRSCAWRIGRSGFCLVQHWQFAVADSRALVWRVVGRSRRHARQATVSVGRIRRRLVGCDKFRTMRCLTVGFPRFVAHRAARGICLVFGLALAVIQFYPGHVD